MKEVGLSHWTSLNTGATNSSAFTALPNQWQDQNGGFDLGHTYGTWWSSSNNTNGAAVTVVYFTSANATMSSNPFGNKTIGYSVRCVQ